MQTTTKAVISDVVETLEDGRMGFEDAAAKLENDGRPDLAIRFRDFSTQRARFSAELRDFAVSLGFQIDEGGSAAGALHRGWMALKDALTNDDPNGVLDAAEQGEDHAVAEYERALDHNTDVVPTELRDLLVRQFNEVRAAHDEVRAMRESSEAA